MTRPLRAIADRLSGPHTVPPGDDEAVLAVYNSVWWDLAAPVRVLGRLLKACRVARR